MDYRNRILIVDDDPALLEQLEQILEQDYRVSLASSKRQAVEFLRGDHRVDLILLDIMMPKEDGYAALQAIRQIPRHKKTPVIFLTSLTGPEAEVRGLLSGAEDYITKPYTPLVLKGRMERALRTAGHLDQKKLSALPQPLSETELQAAILLAQGYNNEEIARILSYTLGSVKNLLVRVMNKLGISSRKEIREYMK